MSQTVNMPALGESVTEGTVTRWLKEVGETVEVDEPLLEVATDKVDTEIPSPVAGVLEEILVQEDETVEVGAELARIGDGSGAAGAPAEEQAAPVAESAPAPEQPASALEPAPAAESAPAAAPAAEQPAPAEAAEQPAADSGDREPITMPALGESVTEGTVTRWLKEVGEEVEMDEPLLEVATDKVDTEIPSPVAGPLVEIVAGEDETVEVGEVLAYVGSGAPAQPEPAQPAPAQPEPAQAAPAPSAPAPEPAAPAAPQPETPPAPAQPRAEAPAVSATGGGYVTPLVRKL